MQKTNIILGVISSALVAISTSAYTSSETFLQCYYSNSKGFDFYADTASGIASMQFFGNGDSFMGRAHSSSNIINLNSSESGLAGVASVRVSINLTTNKFTLNHSVNPSQEVVDLGLYRFNRHETGTCYKSKDKKIPHIQHY